MPHAIVVYCPVDVAIGGTFWRFRDASHWPPEIPVTINGLTYVSEPHAVPGTVTLTSPTTAIFRADVDGSELQMAKVESNPILDGCL